MTSIETDAAAAVDQRAELKKAIDDGEKHFSKSEKRWNFWYYSCTSDIDARTQRVGN